MDNPFRKLYFQTLLDVRCLFVRWALFIRNSREVLSAQQRALTGIEFSCFFIKTRLIRRTFAMINIRQIVFKFKGLNFHVPFKFYSTEWVNGVLHLSNQPCYSWDEPFLSETHRRSHHSLLNLAAVIQMLWRCWGFYPLLLEFNLSLNPRLSLLLRSSFYTRKSYITQGEGVNHQPLQLHIFTSPPT